MAEASPYKSVADELEAFRKAFRSLAQRYVSRMEAEIASLRETVLAAAETTSAENGGVKEESVVSNDEQPAAKVSRAGRKNGVATVERQADQIHDLRDILTLLRTFELNPDVAKRRDFKQVENMLEEIREMTRRWS